MKNVVVKSLFVAGLGLTVLGGVSANASVHAKHLSISLSKATMNSKVIKGHATKNAKIKVSRYKTIYGYGKVSKKGTFSVKTKALKGGWKYRVTVSKKGYKTIHKYLKVSKKSATKNTQPTLNSSSVSSVNPATSSSSSSSMSSSSSNSSSSSMISSSSNSSSNSSMSSSSSAQVAKDNAGKSATQTSSANTSTTTKDTSKKAPVDKKQAALDQLKTQIASETKKLSDNQNEIGRLSQQLASEKTLQGNLETENKAKLLSDTQVKELNELTDKIASDHTQVNSLIKQSGTNAKNLSVLQTMQQSLKH